MTEEWRAVRGFEGVYEVSDQGRVRRIAGPDSAGRMQRQRFLRPRMTRKGYVRVSLHFGGLQERHIHVMVAEAFIGPRLQGMECNHRDGVKTNNAVANLEWLTPTQNVQHAVATGLRPSLCGTRNGRARLTEAQVHEIRASTETGKVLAVRMGVSPQLVSAVRRGEVWRHLMSDWSSGEIERRLA